MTPQEREQYRKRYGELKSAGEPFYPYAIAKDVIAVLAVFLIIAALTIAFGTELELPADPTDTNYNPRPEWYFLAVFELLKYFPGSLEPVATVVLPAAFILLLIAVPFLDRRPDRRPARRALTVGIGVVAVIGWIVLTTLAATAPNINPPSAHDPLVVQGRRLYGDLKCAYCHSIRGEGGTIGPDLSTVGARRDLTWLTLHFKNPQQVTPGSVMPQLRLAPEEINALGAYMESLGGGAARFSPAAPKLFAKHCAECHVINGVGTAIGPDLSFVGRYREAAWIETYIHAPSKVSKDAVMPDFDSKLSPAQIHDLALFLAAHQ